MGKYQFNARLVGMIFRCMMNFDISSQVEDPMSNRNLPVKHGIARIYEMHDDFDILKPLPSLNTPNESVL